MALASPSSAEVLDIRDASARGLALMEEKVRHFKKMAALALSLTSPSQWVVFEGKGPNGEQRESVYPTGGASERILRHAFGFGFRVESMTVEDTGDGRLATCEMSLVVNDRVFETFKGYRYIGGYIKNEASLRSGAEENAKSKAVRSLLGLRFLSKADYKEIGLDLDKLERRASFESHDKDPGTMVAPFGKQKGQPIPDLTDDNLEWLAETIEKSVGDPGRAKFKARNQALLDVLHGEYKRRHAQAEKASEKPAPSGDRGGPYDYGPPPMEPGSDG